VKSNKVTQFVISCGELSDAVVVLCGSVGVPFSVGVIWVVLFGIGLLVQFPSVFSC
jgi:hypothetical protein